jgi:hypothetical protein
MVTGAGTLGILASLESISLTIFNKCSIYEIDKVFPYSKIS